MNRLILLFVCIIALITVACFWPGSGEPNTKENNMRDWYGIVIHHSGSNYDNFKSIDSYHRGKGWDMCGYNYVIEKDGKVFEGRPLIRDGAHALNPKPSRNSTHIGICLTGDENFSLRQHMAILKLCKKLAKEYSIKSIERHHEECPGTNVDVENLNKAVLRPRK